MGGGKTTKRVIKKKALKKLRGGIGSSGEDGVWDDTDIVHRTGGLTGSKKLRPGKREE